MNPILEDYLDFKSNGECGDTAAALLVVAKAIKESSTFSRANAENFGHELALALKNVLSESTFSVSLEVDGEVPLSLTDTVHVSVSQEDGS